jgi:hypothetical protein
VIQKEIQLHQIVVFWDATTQYRFVIAMKVWEEQAASIFRNEASLKMETACCSETWYPTYSWIFATRA